MSRGGTTLLFLGVFGAAPALLFALLPESSYAPERALCDRVVKTLLTSADLVEVTRAGIIVNRLNCSVGRRLNLTDAAP